jgi:hypothetical protein
MDAHPLCVGPSAQIDDSGQTIGIQVSPYRIAPIQRGDSALEPLFEIGELAGHLSWRYSFLGANPHPNVLKSRLAAKATDVLGLRYVQPCHRLGLPTPRGFDRREIPAKCAVPDLAKNKGKGAP